MAGCRNKREKIVRENFPSDLLNVTLSLGLLENSKDPLKYVDNPLIKVFAKVVIIPWQWEPGTRREGRGWWVVSHLEIRVYHHHY